MRIVILGSGVPSPSPERGGSAILITTAGRHYLFDCGQGATRQMVRANVSPVDVNHVFFSHLHYDHIIDFPYFILTGWMYERAERATVIGPAGTRNFVDHLFAKGAFADDIKARLLYPQRQKNIFALEPDVREVEPGVIFEDDVAKVSAAYVEHIPRDITACFALKLEAEGRTVVFSGDTAPCDAVVELASGADLLLHECTFPEQALAFRKSTGVGIYAHTSPIELGKIAARAGVKSLVATHFAAWSSTHPVVLRHLTRQMPMELAGPHLTDLFVEDIRNNYSGELRMAHDLMRIDL